MGNSGDDVRIKIGADSIVIAVRCGSGHGSYLSTFGMSASSVVTSSTIRLVESKIATSPRYNCKINVRPQSFPNCRTSPTVIACFALSGETLDFRGSPLFTGDGVSTSGPNDTFTKVSD